MNTTNDHLKALRALHKNFGTESGDVVIGRMIPEFAALMVVLSEDLDKAQQKVVRLTWALFWLTLFLAVVGVAQLVAAFMAA